MQNPFRSEAEAFRFLIRTIAYFAVIAVAALINTWLGVAVFVIATAVIVWWLGRTDARRCGEPRHSERRNPTVAPHGRLRMLRVRQCCETSGVSTPFARSTRMRHSV